MRATALFEKLRVNCVVTPTSSDMQYNVQGKKRLGRLLFDRTELKWPGSGNVTFSILLIWKSPGDHANRLVVLFLLNLICWQLKYVKFEIVVKFSDFFGDEDFL